MWKYRCRSQFLTLVGAFLAGFLMAAIFRSNPAFQDVLAQSLPPEALSLLGSDPILINISAGLGFAGLVNVFTISNLLSTYYPGAMFLVMMAVLMLPGYALSFGVLSLPVMLAITLYGWISLTLSTRQALKKAGLNGDDEIVRIYLLHHKLDPQYEALGRTTRKTIARINLASSLGLVAVFCAVFFLDNLLISMLLVIVCVMAFQFLARDRANSFAAISRLLVEQCDPEACMSALLYFAKRGEHYSLKNRALIAQCLIYLNEPELAQDVLIRFSRSSPSNTMAYYSLMGYIYYLLKDENGLIRSREALAQIRPQMGTMGLMVKSEEMAALENKINLMRGDFNACKKYYLSLLKRSGTSLQKADCDYYIALISFVQEDYVVAKMYFERTLQIGNRLYFVTNAKNYLEKIEQSNALDDEDEQDLQNYQQDLYA